MNLAIVSFGHVDSILHYAKTLSKDYKIKLIFVFALNKKSESILNFENEELQTGFLDIAQVNRILGDNINNFINNDFSVKFFINYNLKIRSLKNIVLARNLALYLKNFDLIHFNGMDATLLLINLFLRKKRKVFTIHDVKLHTGENDNKILNFPETMTKWLVKSKYQIIIQNQSDYKNIINLYPSKKNKINIIPFKNLSIYKNFIKNYVPSIKSDILFFGRISEYKGIKYLLEAIKIVKLTLPNIRVLIAGKGKIDKSLIEKDVIDNVMVINRYISNEELVNYIIDTKAVVCPYIDATQSGVVMTSFAFNKPVIASAVGGFIDVIEEKVTGILVPPKDSIRLAEAIVSLLVDEEKIKKMSDNIKNKCENGNFSWDTITNDVRKVYEKALMNIK